MSGTEPIPHERSRYMAGEGYVIFSDFGHQFIDELADLPVVQAGETIINARELALYDADPGAYGVYQVAQILNERAAQLGERRRSPNRIPETASDTALEDNQVTQDEWTGMAGHTQFQNGLGDAHFSVHFIPLVAVDSLRSVADTINLADEERRAFTLQDYAGIMRTDWFKSMLHDLAMTGNSVWQTYGTLAHQYKANDIGPEKSHLANEIRMGGHAAVPFYETAIHDHTDEQGERVNEAAIGLSRLARQGLTARIRDRDSVGCPVAHATRIVDPTNARTQRLVEQGHMSLFERPSGKTVGHQYTPIEHAADVLADYFDRYYDAYGQPGVSLRLRDYLPNR